MSNLTPLPSPPISDKADPDVVLILEHVLEVYRLGKIEALALCLYGDDIGETSQFTGPPSAQMIGLLELAKNQAIENWREAATAMPLD